MATTNPSVVRAYREAQDLFTITHPYADLTGPAIAGVSKDTTAVVTLQATMPGTWVSGLAIIITGVGGMTQLATAGENGTDKFYINPLDGTTFELYSDAELSTAVDSSSFTTATANTGNAQAFAVTEYEGAGSSVAVVFNESGPVVGSNISVDTSTGVISVDGGDFTYTLTATAFINVPGATYQWYNVTGEPQAFGASAPVGAPVTLVYSPVDPEDLALIVTAADGTTFAYPTQITNAQAVIEVASGFVA